MYFWVRGRLTHSAGIRYLGLARISRAPGPSCLEPPYCLSCAASGGFWIHHDISSPAPGVPRRTRIRRIYLLDIYIAGTAPYPPVLPLPLSASGSGLLRLLTTNPTLGCAASRGLALRYDADLCQYIIVRPESWLTRTQPPTVWTRCVSG